MACLSQTVVYPAARSSTGWRSAIAVPLLLLVTACVSFPGVPPLTDLPALNLPEGQLTLSEAAELETPDLLRLNEEM